MAKVTAPLLSFGGSGQIGKTQVYSKWRGITYARRYVIPANPSSDSQKATRGVFSWLNGTWKVLNVAVQAPWTAFAKGQPFTDRNAYIKKNLKALRGTDLDPATTLAGYIASPGANAGLAATSIGTVDATGHIATVTLGLPALPAAWAAVAAHAVAFVDANANISHVYTSKYDTEPGDSGVIALDCGAAATWDIFAWWEYTKPDGSTAYSPSLYAQQVLA